MRDTNLESTFRLVSWATEEEVGTGATITLVVTDPNGVERSTRVWMSEDQQLRLGMWLMARDSPEL